MAKKIRKGHSPPPGDQKPTGVWLRIEQPFLTTDAEGVKLKVTFVGDENRLEPIRYLVAPLPPVEMQDWYDRILDTQKEQRAVHGRLEKLDDQLQCVELLFLARTR